MPVTADQIKRRLDSVMRRAEAARANIDRLEGNLREIETERLNLEAAYLVVTELEEEGDEVNIASHKANGAGEPTQRALITMILKMADRPMKPAEILALALAKHGRKIPSGTLHGNLYRWKKEGRVINSKTGWSLAPPISSSPNPQPERPDQEERR